MPSPNFTRRHFCRIAALLEGGMGDLDKSGRQYVADRPVELFQSDNGRLQPSRFTRRPVSSLRGIGPRKSGPTSPASRPSAAS